MKDTTRKIYCRFCGRGFVKGTRPSAGLAGPKSEEQRLSDHIWEYHREESRDMEEKKTLIESGLKREVHVL